MELQGVIRLRARSVALLLIVLLAPATARAATTTATAPSTPVVTSVTSPLPATPPVTNEPVPGTPVLVGNATKPPSGYRLTGAKVLAIARRDPLVKQELVRYPDLVPYEYTKTTGVWQVSWFTRPAPNRTQKERIQVYVSDTTGQVTQVWTGFQVAWTMARGYDGAFGRKVNRLYVWLPMCLAFLLPFLPWRRRPTMWHLDLLVLLGFSVSLAYFNHANLGLSVPLVYPCLLYLLVRLLLLAGGRGRPREPLRLLLPTPVIVVGLVFLIGFRVGLNITDSNVIDVGYAGVIGANKVLYGHKLYGHWPADNPAGDTYAPVNYYAYVPFNVAFGWSGAWDDLPAAHAAAIAFDLLTMLGLFLLGRSIRGPTTGTVLAYLWAAYPFTLFTLSSNSNDSLVALMVVIAMLALRHPIGRGVSAALAGLTKFAPLLLAPLFLRGTGPAPPSRRHVARFVLAYGITGTLMMAYVVITGDLSAFWKDTVSYQVGRPAPFSIWGLWGGLTWLQRLAEGATIGLAIAVAFIPRERELADVAALGAAVLIALQLCLTYWFYLYIPWFFPLVIVALVVSHPPRTGAIRLAAAPAGASQRV